MIPFSGFAPDVDPTSAGVITDCDDLLPTVRGFKAMPSPSSTTLAALAATCYGAAVMTKLDGTRRFFAGTDTKLYEAGSTAWTDCSRTGNYTTGDKRWRFAQFGDVTLATNKSDVLQASTTAAFSDISGAPKASVMDVAGGFVMLAATNEATYGDQTDRWWCSAYQDHTSWTPSVTTQATTGRLVDSPGAIRAMKALGSNFIAYKDRAIFLGQYVSAPAVWQWTMVPGEIGCSSQEAVINIGSLHFFVGDNDIYSFDGNRPIAIGGPIKRWFFNTINKSYKHLTLGMHDRANSSVWFFFVTGSAGILDSAIVYNYAADKWGKCSINVETAIEYVSGAMTIDGMNSLSATIDGLPSISFDSPFWSSANPMPAIIDPTHTVKTITGTSAGCSITTGEFGDDARHSLLSRDRPRFVQAPTSGTMTNLYAATSGETYTPDQTVAMTNGKFDVLRAARWHKLKFDLEGDCEIVGHTPDLRAEGLE